MAQPDEHGICNVDAMNVIGGGSNIPTICGENSGLHIYVDFNGNSNIRIVISTSGDVTVARSWKLKIAQIACDCPSKGTLGKVTTIFNKCYYSRVLAPAGCLQYYTELSGTVRSFNYGSTVSSAILPGGQPGTRQLANTNYGICVAMVAGYCGIQWSQPTDVFSFTVTGNTGQAAAAGIVGTPAASVTGIACTTDFIVIPNPFSGGVAVGADRFCGNGLPVLTSMYVLINTKYPKAKNIFIVITERTLVYFNISHVDGSTQYLFDDFESLFMQVIESLK